MFGQDVVTHFTELIKLKQRYLGDIKGLLKIEQLWRLYQITAYNLLKARKHDIKDQSQRHIPQPSFKPRRCSPGERPCKRTIQTQIQKLQSH